MLSDGLFVKRGTLLGDERDQIIDEKIQGGKISDEQIFAELWVSLGSVLRSYVALHGMNRHAGEGASKAAVEWDGERILARSGERWLELRRRLATVSWKRQDALQGELELTLNGRLRDVAAQDGSDEEEMDLKAEMWARELMR